jgi:hypothetical protein
MLQYGESDGTASSPKDKPVHPNDSSHARFPKSNGTLRSTRIVKVSLLVTRPFRRHVRKMQRALQYLDARHRACYRRRDRRSGGAAVHEISAVRKVGDRPRHALLPHELVDFEALRDWEYFDADTGKDFAREIREYFIPDFRRWKNDHDAYKRELDGC